MAELSRMPTSLRWPAWLTWLALAALSAGPATGQSASHAGVPLERKVKAAYLYKFAAFVAWPDTSFARPDSPLQIGVAGNEALADLLETMLAGRSANGHPLALRRLRPGDGPAGLHILFLDASLAPAARQSLLSAADGLALLTVSDAGPAQAPVSMINFVLEQDKLRFDVVLAQVHASHLRISARMLAAAHHVQGAS
ncbi:MAG TPA: YfiR family protein [Telluria sp.]|jgi:hypothetical protein